MREHGRRWQLQRSFGAVSSVRCLQFTPYHFADQETLLDPEKRAAAISEAKLSRVAQARNQSHREIRHKPALM